MLANLRTFVIIAVVFAVLVGGVVFFWEHPAALFLAILAMALAAAVWLFSVLGPSPRTFAPNTSGAPRNQPRDKADP